MRPLLNLFTAPWAITQAGLETVVGVWSRGEAYQDRIVEALKARDGEPLRNARHVDLRDVGVAIIPMAGPMIRHASMFDDVSGCVSYETLRKDFQAAIDDPAVQAIVLNIDSPGGEVHGAGELSAAIYAARGIKPIIAYAGGTMASAAYWIGSAADQIVLDPSAMVGSIGVRTVLVDSSGFDDKLGVKAYHMVSDQSPLKVVDAADAEDRARVKQSLTELAAVFVEDVARNRAVSTAKVLADFGRGDVLVGQAAVDAGMADSLGDLEAVIADLTVTKMRRFSMANGSKATIDDEECDNCGRGMSGGDATYCQTCYAASASAQALLGVEAKDVPNRLRALVDAEQRLFSLTEAATIAEAIGKARSGMDALRDLETVRAELATVKTTAARRDLRAMLEAGLDSKRLSLGAIQRSIPLVLRGAEKTAWTAAMGKLEAVTRETVLAAATACAGSLSDDDMAAITEYVKASPAVAASPYVEPQRDAQGEGEELDETSRIVKAAADAARKTLDRGKTAAAK